MSGKNQLEQAIRSHINGYSHGYFVTIDTHYTTLNNRIDNDFMTNFAGEIRGIFRALNIYTFGRNYRRYDRMKKQGIPTTTDARLKEVTAYEIGEGGRLHLHSMLLHNGGCQRTTKQVKNRIKKICTYNPHTRLTGASALHVETYNADLEDEWVPYFLKSYDYFMNSNGFLNIDMV
jgi:hypothetical protein